MERILCFLKPVTTCGNHLRRIEKLRESLHTTSQYHTRFILEQPTLKDAHIYCVIEKISAQSYGPLLEKYIQNKFGYSKTKAEKCEGDCSKGGERFEIKVSLGGSTHKKFNYVQIRPSHSCNFYIFTAYHLAEENLHTEGELYIFKIPGESLKSILVEHGGYAHGTVKEHGKITKDGLLKEYALRPSFGDACWKSLLPFRISEDDL